MPAKLAVVVALSARAVRLSVAGEHSSGCCQQLDVPMAQTLSGHTYTSTRSHAVPREKFTAPLSALVYEQHTSTV